MERKIKIKSTLRELIRQPYNGYPKLFMLGQNSLKIISAIEPITINGGCEQMTRASATMIQRAAAKIYDKGLIPCGIARVGYNINQNRGDDYERGEGLYDLFDSSQKAVMVTRNERDIYAEVKCRGRIKVLDCLIVE